jgi:hypothetical protein
MFLLFSIFRGELTTCLGVNSEATNRADFFKQAFVAAAMTIAAVPAVNAAVVEPEVSLNFGKNPANWSGQGKQKGTKGKASGNAGSIYKK